MAEIRVPLSPYFTQESIHKLKSDISGLNLKISDVDVKAGQSKAAMLQEEKLVEQLKDLKDIYTKVKSGQKLDDATTAAGLHMASEGFESIAKGMMSILQTSFDVLSSIYKELRKSSPLLEAIDQIFQLAWTLFFMPLGNKLGELLIPAVIELVDQVVQFWSEFGGGGLGEIFEKAFEYGIRLMSNFFNNIGQELQEQGGFLGKIGEILLALSDFVRGGLGDALKFILSWAEWNIEHIGLVITLITTFMSLHYALQLATMATIAGTGTLAGLFGAGAVIAAAGGVAAGGIIAGVSGLPMAEGGKVPATPEGTLILAGEGGEDEWIVPESKKLDFARSVIDSMPSTIQPMDFSSIQSIEASLNDIIDVTPIQNIGTSDVVVPEVTVPDIEVPEVTIPEEDILDAISVSNINLPEVTVPDIEIPRTALPDIVPESVVQPYMQTQQPEASIPEVNVTASVDLTDSLSDIMSRVPSVPQETEYVSNVTKSTSNTTNHYNINISGYTDNELKTYIKDVVNEEVARSRIRSGF